jgi:hypothetical protein
MTQNSQSSIPLDELNIVIAEQKGVSLDELAVSEEGKPKDKKAKSAKEEIIVPEVVEAVSTKTLTPTEMRSKADKLFKEAQALRKQADAIDPPKKRAKVEAEAE